MLPRVRYVVYLPTDVPGGFVPVVTEAMTPKDAAMRATRHKRDEAMGWTFTGTPGAVVFAVPGVGAVRVLELSTAATPLPR